MRTAKTTDRRRRLLALAGVVGLLVPLLACGVGGVSVGQSGTPVPQEPTAAETCRAQGPTYAYQPGDAMLANPFLKCVFTGLIGEVDAGTATVSYLVETYKNCNPDGQQTVTGWTLYAQNPTNPKVTATPGKYTGVGPTAPLYTGNSPTQKGCFSGVTGVISKLTGTQLPTNLTLDELRNGVLIFNEGSATTNLSPLQHPSLVVSISQHLSSCPCDYNRLTLLPGDPTFLGTASAPGQVAQEARLVYVR